MSSVRNCNKVKCINMVNTNNLDVSTIAITKIVLFNMV